MNMKKILTAASIVLLISSCSAQFPQKGKGISLKGVLDGINSNIPLTNADIIKGLKEALSKGASFATTSTSVTDGFLKNPKITIPLPQDIKNIEKTARNIGLGSKVDELLVKINRSAELAAKEALPIFGGAIRDMSIQDGMQILKGQDNAATVFLKNSTQTQIFNSFKPVIEQAMSKVQVASLYNDIATTYNRFSPNNKINSDLNTYITNKAIEGLFTMVAEEELKIRKDPLARTTDILKRVFGN